MIDKGNLHSRQYLDLLPQSYPPQEGDADSREHPAETDPMSEASRLRPPSDEPRMVEQRPGDGPTPAVTSSATEPEEPAAQETDQSSHPEGSPSERGDVSSSPYPSGPPRESESSGSYGPVRRRVSGKDGPMSLWRPPALKQEDFIEIVKEVVPQLVEDACADRPKRPFYHPLVIPKVKNQPQVAREQKKH